MNITKTIIAVLLALGLGAGGGLYYSNGEEVPPKDLDAFCAEWKPPLTVNSCSGICVTDTLTFQEEDGTRYETTREELINFKKER